MKKFKSVINAWSPKKNAVWGGHTAENKPGPRVLFSAVGGGFFIIIFFFK